MNVFKLFRRLAALTIPAVLIVAAGFSLRSLEAQPASPVNQAQPGDWVSLKINNKTGIPVLLKLTLIAKDETTATIKNEPTVKFDQPMGDKVLPAHETKIPLGQLRDPTKLIARLEKGHYEKVSAGKETLEVKGKKIACDWMAFKVSFTADGKTIASNSKIWTAAEIPLEGLVKLENESPGLKTSTMELVDFGRGQSK